MVASPSVSRRSSWIRAILDWWRSPPVRSGVETMQAQAGAGGRWLTSAALQLVDLVAMLVHGTLNALACLIAGTGVALVTVGVFAIRQPAAWGLETMRHAGPPMGPLALGLGVGLLTTLLFLAIAFRRR